MADTEKREFQLVPSDEEDEEQGSGPDEEQAGPEQKKKRKRNKEKPAEMSAKVPVSRFRRVVPGSKREFRDPRFDDQCGEFNEAIYRKRFRFLDDYKQSELEDLKKAAKRVKNEDDKQKLQAAMVKYKQDIRNQELRDKQREKLAEWKHEEAQKVKEGKKRFFLKKSDERNLMLAAKYETLKKEGKLDKFLEKKRKKKASKDHKLMPFKRRSTEEQE